MSELEKLVLATSLTPAETSERTGAIYTDLLDQSRYMQQGNFRSFHAEDLRRLFQLYDATFFAGHVGKHLGSKGITFRISPRMTSAGGKTTRFRMPNGLEYYEITVASTLLFKTFTENDHRPVSVTGIACRDRLEALQRVFEHELVHLLEMVLWKDSNCRANRFQTLATRLFTHREHTHRLITPREQAYVKFGIRPGVWVRFRFEGREYRGLVNRVTKRATVLVPSPRGARFSDGKHYETYYVPVSQLQTLDGPMPDRERA
jgi:hypothetical protein